MGDGTLDNVRIFLAALGEVVVAVGVVYGSAYLGKHLWLRYERWCIVRQARRLAGEQMTVLQVSRATQAVPRQAPKLGMGHGVQPLLQPLLPPATFTPIPPLSSGATESDTDKTDKTDDTVEPETGGDGGNGVHMYTPAQYARLRRLRHTWRARDARER